MTSTRSPRRSSWKARPRLLAGQHDATGALAPGQAFDAADVLGALRRDVDGFEVRPGEQTTDRPTPV
ncbi:hypothetical protein [Actinotalea subterranea]|uniref:hypothetical protein n=1 Tax=Actinotalea subterranea TaxID=2607497 RepID=UPI0011ED253C|nr:hypothetical protein [Actinotalea subterranea]